MTTHRDTLLLTAARALRGEISDILVRTDGSAVLLNAAKELMWTGYSPEAELLKGMIVKVSGGAVQDLVAGCLPKFYNWGENATNDATFRAALSTPGARVYFLAKEDGSNARPYVHPDKNRVEFATRGMLQTQSGADEYADYCAMMHEVARAKYPALLNVDLVRRYTFVCELIHPNNRIVTNYGDRRDLPVLAVIDNTTGAELSRDEVLALCAKHKLHPVAAFTPRSTNPIDAITELKRAWGNSDVEGVVVTVELPESPTPFRIKIKGDRYLYLFRLMFACTLKRTRELCEANNVSSWSQLRAILLREAPDLPEEVQMGYRAHFERWNAWNNTLLAEIDADIAAYNALPTRNADQKTFAASIANHPRKHMYFTFRSHGIAEARIRLLEKMRIHRKAELRAGRNEIPDPSLAG